MRKYSRLFAIITALLLLTASIPAFAASLDDIKIGMVTADSLNLRAEPLSDSSITGKAANGELVVISGKSGDDWYIVNCKGTSGYMSAEFINIVDEAVVSCTGRVSGSGVNVRSAPNTGASRLGIVNTGDTLPVTGVSGGWFKVTYKSGTGYIHPNFMQINVANSEASDSVSTGSTSGSGLASKIVSYAKTLLGTPYVYGTMSGKSFDCSGFTTYVFKHNGVSLTRTAMEQVKLGKGVEKPSLQAGDLVFFADKAVSKNYVSHVGMYIGGGKFIHCSSSKNNSGVVISDLTEGYYGRVYKTARRVI